jgi:hypothetical protein
MNNTTDTFKKIVSEIGVSGAFDAVLDYYEYQARISARTNPAHASAIEAALLFAQGFDVLATEQLADICGMSMAVRLVRNARIQAADSVNMYFPGRQAA